MWYIRIYIFCLVFIIRNIIGDRGVVSLGILGFGCVEEEEVRFG